MKKFPGEVYRDCHHKVILNDEQREWFVKYYPIVENDRISKAMNVGSETVRRLRTLYGLEKSEKGMKAIRKRRAKRAAKTNEKNGCFARKRGVPVSEATREGLRRLVQERREGKRLNPIAQLRATNRKAYEALLKRRSEERKELIRKEKMRVVYGLERKTKLKVVVLKPYTKSQAFHRWAALRRGYLLDEDCSEGTTGRYTIYYDDETQRSERFEENCKKIGFVFKRDR